MEEMEKIDLQWYIDNRIQESINLDYKKSNSLDDKAIDEISKDVSAFANSLGGKIIYGIMEDNRYPINLDDGIEYKKMSRERLENIIQSNIYPSIEGIKIRTIKSSEERNYYVVEIPQSNRAPHQDRKSKKYYKRYNFKAEAMEDYEIQDIRARAKTKRKGPEIILEPEYGAHVFMNIENITTEPYINLKLAFSPEPNWINRDILTTNLFSVGIEEFHPGMKLKYHLGAFAFEDTCCTKFNVIAEYLDQFSGQVEYFTKSFNLKDLQNSILIKTKEYEQNERIIDLLKILNDSVSSLSSSYKEIMMLIRNGAINVSPILLKNMECIRNGEDVFKLSPYNHSYEYFQAILQIDFEEAYNVMRFFDGHNGTNKLSEISEISDDTKRKIDIVFKYN